MCSRTDGRVICIKFHLITSNVAQRLCKTSTSDEFQFLTGLFSPGDYSRLGQVPRGLRWITFQDCRINALHQWCLRMLFGIKWYHFISNDEVQRQTNQPLLTEIIQAQHLTLFGHIAQMDDNVDAKQILTSSPSVYWKRPPGRPRMTWM